MFTFASAYALQSNGLRYASTDKEIHGHFITASLAKYREALTRMSLSALSLRNYAQMLAWEGDRAMAGEYFAQALQLAPNDASTLLAVPASSLALPRIPEFCVCALIAVISLYCLCLCPFLVTKEQMAKWMGVQERWDEAEDFRTLTALPSPPFAISLTHT